MKRDFEAVKRIVIKIGTSSLVAKRQNQFGKNRPTGICHFQLGQ